MKAFTSVNGHEVFDNGEVRKWRCEDCRWWLDWADERCRVCGASRDGAAPKRRPVKTRVKTLMVMRAA